MKLVPTAPSVNLLWFGDDYIIFSRASLPDAESIKQILNVYELAGQKVNFDKTNLSFSRRVPDDRSNISQLLAVQVLSSRLL